MSRLLPWIVGSAALAAFSAPLACTTELPAIDPAKLACTSDTALPSGELPCPETHWCGPIEARVGAAIVPEVCLPRLDCRVPLATRDGCDPEETREARCDAVINDETAAVRCFGGTHTTTSAIPADLDACDCPDGTYCVAFADDPAVPPGDAFPLYLLPSGTALPVGRLGVRGEVPERRRCVRACGSEQDCPGAHTCRAAAVVTPGLLAEPSSTRSTIGVCYPDFLTNTSTQAVPGACESDADCPVSASIEPCRIVTRGVPDHPTVPAGAAWPSHSALEKRCGSESSTLQGEGRGCSRSSDCISGACVSGKCAPTCAPGRERCFSNAPCEAVLVERTDGMGRAVEDRVFVCKP
ncbi:hypothetical protein L6R52_33295 [Myxococcota bacterium]|nr:hypothetical protein [Myxococcota bacterium]